MNRKIYFLVLSVAIIGFCLNVVMMMNSQRSVPYAETMPSDGKLATLAPPEIDVPKQALPKVYNLPPVISWPQVIKLHGFLYQFGVNNNSTTVPDAYYREGSLYTDSGRTLVLVDIPSLKQTISVEVMPNDTLDISCGLPVEQKEASWRCSDNLLGESE